MQASECEWIHVCPFFEDPVGYSPEMGMLFVEHYCRGQFESCARYVGMLAVGADRVPDDLLPTDFGRMDALARGIEGSPDSD